VVLGGGRGVRAAQRSTPSSTASLGLTAIVKLTCFAPPSTFQLQRARARQMASPKWTGTEVERPWCCPWERPWCCPRERDLGVAQWERDLGVAMGNVLGVAHGYLPWCCPWLSTLVLPMAIYLGVAHGHHTLVLPIAASISTRDSSHTSRCKDRTCFRV